MQSSYIERSELTEAFLVPIYDADHVEKTVAKFNRVAGTISFVAVLLCIFLQIVGTGCRYPNDLSLNWIVAVGLIELYSMVSRSKEKKKNNEQILNISLRRPVSHREAVWITPHRIGLTIYDARSLVSAISTRT